MTKGEILRNVTAINELISIYTVASRIVSDKPRASIIAEARKIIYDEGKTDCPLCWIHKDACGDCPWVLFTGRTCYSQHYELDPFLKRIQRLRDWKHKLLTRLLEEDE